MRSTITDNLSERDAFIALSFAEGIGGATLLRLYKDRIPYKDALMQLPASISVEALHARRAAVQQRAADAGADVLTILDTDYPQPLLDLTDAPPLLFARGLRHTLQLPTVAIVGTRAATRYGDRVARQLGESLASAGACVISGLARGVDSAAHRGALAASGATCAVLGTGIDLTYPAGHASLQRSIAERGLVLTESLPGARPTLGSFPKRNRIIAALAAVTIVVEAGRKSGALNTASHALNLGRTVAAVPGPIDSMQSVGSNQLVRDGAQVIASIEDALSLLGLHPRSASVPERELSPAETILLHAIGDRQLTTQQAVEISALPVSECLAAISSLEVIGLIEANLTGEFRRCGSISRSHPLAAST